MVFLNGSSIQPSIQPSKNYEERIGGIPRCQARRDRLSQIQDKAILQPTNEREERHWQGAELHDMPQPDQILEHHWSNPPTQVKQAIVYVCLHVTIIQSVRLVQDCLRPRCHVQFWPICSPTPHSVRVYLATDRVGKSANDVPEKLETLPSQVEWCIYWVSVGIQGGRHRALGPRQWSV